MFDEVNVELADRHTKSILKNADSYRMMTAFDLLTDPNPAVP